MVSEALDRVEGRLGLRVYGLGLAARFFGLPEESGFWMLCHKVVVCSLVSPSKP